MTAVLVSAVFVAAVLALLVTGHGWRKVVATVALYLPNALAGGAAAAVLLATVVGVQS